MKKIHKIEKLRDVERMKEKIIKNVKAINVNDEEGEEEETEEERYYLRKDSRT